MSKPQIQALPSVTKRTVARSRSTVIVKASSRRTINQCMAALAASFLPVASYVIAHVEAVQEGKGYLYALVACALAYSAPTLAKWAERWAGHWVKSWGFTILLECVSILSHIQWLNITAVAILVLINGVTAYGKAGK